ncbi:MAG: transcriptional regulator [Yaniella sp.]|uniref:MarR family winged helix-turn-helix transcriptional regulator n=1 Tax=Yaniella sp. TaxID=2773929 RepID=UPI002649FC27|nr:transcriptional regulator [Yaniella sp.]MDN5704226.1 transcriptional regulator [Yaniella sp.]MDN5731059.1 transcriptional regulator [Yaniella sp.]MDN5743401.1 transcriptional regulator [Yaniella sp.]MDN5815585.1 transcriptional regulator [Yaniella sp.]MDN5817706.1 transcriptional regulator [Yaniella sp.]
MIDVPTDAEDAFVNLDPLLHEPARLAILAALAPAEYVEFSTLLKLVGVSKSSLSKHISALADAGIITIENSPADRRVRRLSLSEPGRESFDVYLQQLEDLVRSARGLGH